MRGSSYAPLLPVPSCIPIPLDDKAPFRSTSVESSGAGCSASWLSVQK